MIDDRSPLQAEDEVLSPTARRARLGWSGFLFVLITVLLAVGAVNSQNNLLFWVFGISVAAVVVSGLISGNGMMGLRLIAHPIPDTEVGAFSEVAYTVVSINRLLPVFGLNIGEQSDERLRRSACVLHIRPRGRERAAAQWSPTRRGVHRFERIALESRFPFGFIVKLVEFEAARTALATPPLIDLDDSILDATGSGVSEHRVRRARRGATGEYFGIRAYNAGDPRRLVAWRPSARRGELLVIEHAEPRGRSVWVHVTRPPAAADPVMIERALSIAVSMVRSGSRSRRPVGVWMPWAGIRLTPSTGPQAVRRAAQAMAVVDLSDTLGPDHAPPSRPGDTVIAVALSAPSGRPDAVLHPSDPSGWLAVGARLPLSLEDRGGGGGGAVGG